ncbi:MAG: peptidylprolyl isomerase [Bacteroidota bacterium]|nr:peptidylprolyl isomerase [Bacteroidota bacterium]MDP4194006.1 peptidylprolyl isomerase [Bacteroidota bacterium]
MRFRIISVLLLITTFILSSCAPEHSKMVVAEYGKDNITLGELESVYAKNAGSLEAAKKDSLPKLKSFLDLYVNFKMKLKDAQARGFDQNSTLQSELNDYKEKVGSTYLIEKEVIEPGVKDLYNKRKYELRVSHIMIRPDTTGDEQAKKLALSLLDRIKKGESFESLARQYSADPYSKNSGGDIYFITAGTIIPDIEDAAYNTPVGQIYPAVVKTRLGYHLIKVTEKRDRIPSLRASHILISFKSDSGAVDTAKALAKIKDIKEQLDKGADFATLARKYSEDPGTKPAGGDLGYFERRMMVKEFDETAFNLKLGQVSDIFKTNYGFHVLKVTDVRAYPSFEESKEELKQLYKKTRYDQDYVKYINGLKNAYKFSFKNNIVSLIDRNADTTRIGKEYYDSKLRKIVKDSVLYSFAGSPVIADSFFKKVEELPDFTGKFINESLVKNALNKIGENEIISSEVKKLEQNDQQFASLMEDYRNGIYIFKLQDDEIWSKIKLDSLKLVEFYNNNKEKYFWPDRIEFSEIFARTDSAINFYYNKLQSGANFDTLAAKYTERPGFKEKAGNYGLVELKSSPLAEEANKLSNEGDYSKPFQYANGYSIVKLIKKDPSHQKSFEEARAEVSGQFQEEESKRLENEYINNLKNKYKPVVFSEELEKAYKSN